MRRNAVVWETRSGGLAELVLGRPQRRNALNLELVTALAERLRRLTADPSVHALLLRAAGPAFCAGLDLREIAEADDSSAWLDTYMEQWHEVQCLLGEAPFPIVIGVDGASINAGAALTLAADYLVLAEDVRWLVGETRQGLAAPMVLAWLTLRHSPAITRQLTLAGAPVSPARLHQLGLAYEVTETRCATARARELAIDLASLPQAGVRNTIAGVRAVSPSPREHFARVLAASALMAQEQFRPESLAQQGAAHV